MFFSMKKNNFFYDLSIYLVAFILFLTIPPYFVWSISGKFQLFLVVLAIFISFVINRRISSKNIQFVIVLSVLYLFFALKDGKNIFGLIATILVCWIFAFKTSFSEEVFNKFCNIYAILMIPSILVYIAVVLLGVSLPYEILDPPNALKDYSYFQYPCLVLSDKLSVNSFRFCSYFDEPGVVGTISGILLLINGINFKKWQTWPIILSGVFSLSLAFYLLLIGNIILFQPLRVKLLLSFVFILIFICFTQNEIVQEVLFERFAFENGKMAGINRTTSSMDFFMHSFWSSDKVVFGYGNNYAQEFVNVGGASYKDLLINYGIFGFGLFALSSLFFAFKYCGFSKRFILFCCVWGSIIYQRPFIFNTIYFYLMYITLFISHKQIKLHS